MVIALILVLCGLSMFAVYMLIRNLAVYKYRTKLAATVFAASAYDYRWRLAMLDQVSYNEMLIRFWKPLDSFYPDKSFLDLSDVRGVAPYEQEKILQAREFIQ